jgi:hypothetical protein
VRGASGGGERGGKERSGGRVGIKTHSRQRIGNEGDSMYMMDTPSRTTLYSWEETLFY